MKYKILITKPIKKFHFDAELATKFASHMNLMVNSITFITNPKGEITVVLFESFVKIEKEKYFPKYFIIKVIMILSQN